MYTVLIIVYVLVAASLVGLVLIQHGKGADAGAAFGSGASGTVFGARGSANFLSRTTAWLAAAFFVLSLTLAYFMHGHATTGSVIDSDPVKPAAVITAPVPAAPKTDAPPAVAVPAQPVTQAAPSGAPVTDAKPAATPAGQPPAKDETKPATPKVPN